MSNKNKNNEKSGGIGFCGLLAIAFIVLKLCGVIAWSWLWVLSPTVDSNGTCFVDWDCYCCDEVKPLIK